jgi:hypothetical protein
MAGEKNACFLLKRQLNFAPIPTQPHPNHNKIGATENMINPLYNINNNAAILIFGRTFLCMVS